MRSFSLPLSDCGLTQAEFYEFFEFLLYWVLVLYLSFRAGIYGTKTGLFSRKIKFVIFACSFASIAAALRRRTFFACTKKVPKKYPEGVRTLSTPMGMGNDMYFFRLYEKSTKKVHRGLASPLDSRGRRQISKNLTAIPQISQYGGNA